MLPNQANRRTKTSAGRPHDFTMVGSLLRLQANTVGDPAFVATIETMIERVGALSSVHRVLHQMDDIRRFDVGTFLRDLVSDVLGAAGLDDVEVIDRIDAVDVEAQSATALGLVTNELLTNVVKHAFAGRRAGRLTIELARQGEEVVLEIADDGPGFDTDAVPGQTLGRSLIARLSRQLRGSTAWTSTPEGTTSVTRGYSQEV